MNAVPSAVREALRALEIDQLVLGIFDASLPGDPSDDLGRGSPYARGGWQLFEFARALGFTGVQLGPQGETAPGDPSPYTSTLFARSRLSLSAAALVGAEPWGGLLREETVAALVASTPRAAAGRAQHEHARAAIGRVLDEVWESFAARRHSEGPAAALAQRLAAFTQRERFWLARSELYEALQQEHASAHWRRWASEIDRRLFNPQAGEERACRARRRELGLCQRTAIERYRLTQLLLHEQHAQLRERLAGLGLELYGDLQIGFSEQDAWSYGALFLEGYRMGAPPSRTNPLGQPWDYPVVDPERYFVDAAAGPVLRLLRARVRKMWREYDALRIDHPHGYVDPWVYRSDADEPFRAVQAGARLFSSPDLPDHPRLAPFAIARPEQLNPARSGVRHADDRVLALDPEQILRYGTLFDALVDSGRRRGRSTSRLVCEVLSTLPNTVGAVLGRHGLGRFRVSQKADLSAPGDVYRSDNARPADWVMLGNHDTPPIWALLDDWQRSTGWPARVHYLASRLCPEHGSRAGFAAELARDPGRLAEAQLADLFASRARNVYVFFSDLFGLVEPYNRPGVVSEENWGLRLAPGYRAEYRERLRSRRALNLAAALALALRAPGAPPAAGRDALLERLDREARELARTELR